MPAGSAAVSALDALNVAESTLPLIETDCATSARSAVLPCRVRDRVRLQVQPSAPATQPPVLVISTVSTSPAGGQRLPRTMSPTSV